jgi:hypothetical protein
MSSVYTNAVCNIAFLVPPEEGFIRRRSDPSPCSFCIIRTDNISDHGYYMGNMTHNRSRNYRWRELV